MLRFVTPIFVVFALSMVWCVYEAEICMSKYGRRMPFALRYYTWMWLFLSILMVGTAPSVFQVMSMTGWLDSARADDLVYPRIEDEEGARTAAEWQKEADLSAYPALKWFSLLTPFFVLATFLVCLGHTFAHVRESRRCTFGARPDPEAVVLHDHVIRILALPFIYGLMSFQGVVRMWGVYADSVGESGHFHAWADRKEYLEDMYEEARLLGDVYETVALLTFGALAMRVLDYQVKNRVRMALLPRTTSIESTLEDELFSEQAAAKLTKSVENLVSEMREVTLYGVTLFAVTCMLQAAYQFTLTTLAYYQWFSFIFRNYEVSKEEGLLHKPMVQTKVEYFFLGAGFLASFAAIGNLVHVERGFHNAELEAFGPFWKFWGTKVLVTVAYVQDCMRFAPPFSGWSDTYFALFYASLVTLECFLISLLHVWAWNPYETWYQADSIFDGFQANASNGLNRAALDSDEDDTMSDDSSESRGSASSSRPASLLLCSSAG